MDFQGKVVLVIGASSGIGAATAVAFANHGANVVVVGRREDKLQEVAKLCEKSGNKTLVVKADITKDEEAVNAVTQTIENFGKLNILINNAGIARPGSIIDGTIMDSYDEIMNTNIRSFVYLTTLAAPHLVKFRGSMVNVSSVGGQSPPKEVKSVSSSYAMSKAALNIFTKGAAYEFAPHGVRVNAISPGPTVTEMLLDPDMVSVEDIKKSVPLNRISEPEEMADLILFLASDKAIGITGSNFVSDNGHLLVA